MAQGAVVRANGRRLKRERRERNLTQLRAAVGIGISPQTLARAENGDEIRPKVLDQIAKYYELDIDQVQGKAS